VLLRLEEVEERLADLRAGRDGRVGCHFNTKLKIQNVKMDLPQKNARNAQNSFVTRRAG
jgi:hypothetical protein